jgi:hypothetical protein
MRADDIGHLEGWPRHLLCRRSSKGPPTCRP